MSQQIGRTLLIKRNAVQDGSGAYTIVCGFQSRNFSMSTNAVETTVADCVNPQNVPEYTAVAGVSNKSFSGSGLFDNDASGKAVADDARLGRIWAYQVVVPGYGDFKGNFIVTDFQFTGETEGAMGFSCTFNPSGPQVFTPE